ncbi:N-formylglutamate deformylase [Asticcacaulis sp. EMRT-3]|uniref:N-formylglutamate deformylase n=1 Tax=Asticcacaulis sp. EMRT-3 TaxID=3040349 RepID=UPI0024AF0FC8|nr:N-formylglutamate deformylase [Asticcacaulis sp. EMRT-3]MDI7774317.1 N-formylglutamate deformylase [Asticcacaulis sp. EMRT-3]
MPSDTPPTDEYPLFDLHRGLGPLVIAAPHVGTHIPPAIAVQMNATGHSVGETDFHVHRLFDFAPEFDATTLFATHSRYVIDLNRPPDDASLYPGRFETGLCPLSDFDLHPIYLPGHEPDDAEIRHRRTRYWQPYHDALRSALDAARARHGYALLIDAHSIRPEIPNLFAGHLPDLNFGTNSGRTLPPRLQEALSNWCLHETRWSHVLDGRFTGGYTTRHYGQPQDDIYALQIEIVQSTYLDLATPHLYEAGLASPLSSALRTLVAALF